MKSQLFSKQDYTNYQRFPKDIKTTFDLQPEVLARLPDFALEALETPTSREQDNVFQGAANSLGVPRAQLDRALMIAGFFLKEFAPDGDAASDDTATLLSDLAELFGLPENKTQGMRTFLDKLRELAQNRKETQIIMRTQATLNSALPILDSVRVAVDIRAVFDHDYNYDQDVSAFSPKLLGTVPLGILELNLSGCDTERVCLQLSTRSLQVLIDHLVALQKQMVIAEMSICAKET
jgi:hypothetical protein